MPIFKPFTLLCGLRACAKIQSMFIVPHVYHFTLHIYARCVQFATFKVLNTVEKFAIKRRCVVLNIPEPISIFHLIANRHKSSISAYLFYVPCSICNRISGTCLRDTDDGMEIVACLCRNPTIQASCSREINMGNCNRTNTQLSSNEI